MARPQSRYVCQSCGDAVLRWEGQCRACGAWNSLVETVIREPSRAARSGSARSGRWRGHGARRSPRSAIPDVPRLTVGIGELDRVLGGGLVPGSLILLGGEPGIGKSTLLLQAAAGLVRGADPTVQVLYATGEESAAQVRLRAGRLGLLDGPAASRVSILAEHDIGQIVEAATRARRRSPSSWIRSRPRRQRRARRSGRQRRAGPRLDGPADGLREGPGGRGHPRRPRHEGRLDRRAQDPRASRRCGREPRGRAVRGAAPAARVEEPIRLDRGDRCVRDGRRRARRGRRPGTRVPRRPRRTGRRQRRGADDGGQPAAARRGPGAGVAGVVRQRRSVAPAGSTRTG